MNKLLGLFLLALAFLAPGTANATPLFAVCTTTCTWNNDGVTTGIMWATSSGGAIGHAAPVAGDDVTLDAATCVGGVTCTITTFAGTISINSLTQSACTASTTGCILDASANNTNFTIAGNYTNTGAGTRTLNMGNGTWTFSSTFVAWNLVASATLNANSSTLAFTGVGSFGRTFTGGGKTYNVVTISATNSGITTFVINGANTFGTLTIAAPNRIAVNNATQTITTFSNVTGSSSSQVLFLGTNGIVTISSANNWTCTWCGLNGFTFTGGGTFTSPNSFDFGGNTGITITSPSGGGGSGRIIGG